MSDSTSVTIMFIGAHHDDNELMAGTMMRHIEAGWRVVSVVMTDGCWTPDDVSDANIERRNNESRAAAKMLDAMPVFLGFKEAGFRNSKAAADAVVKTIFDHRPRVIVTHPPLDYHFDHMETCKCVTDASYRCILRSEEGEPLETHPALYYSDAWFVPFTPDVYVDVSQYAQIKQDTLAAHKSQLPDGGQIEDTMIEYEMVRARFRGIESGCKYAEAFVRANKLQNVRMGGLLGESEAR